MLANELCVRLLFSVRLFPLLSCMNGRGQTSSSVYFRSTRATTIFIVNSFPQPFVRQHQLVSVTELISDPVRIYRLRSGHRPGLRPSTVHQLEVLTVLHVKNIPTRLLNVTILSLLSFMLTCSLLKMKDGGGLPSPWQRSTTVSPSLARP